ncbi:MAG TPA: SDR family oxidoreductase [Longimicrobiales bacterium]|nr:SDR family oxidoreductase [Longimicrobiales bacterium]
MELRGKVAIVTGSTRGIGRAIVDALHAAGARVVVSARSGSAAEAVAGELGEGALGVACDVRSYEDCARLVERCRAEFGRLDILINNAGIGAFAPVRELAPATWRDVIGTNLDGVFFCCHAALPELIAAGESWIINIGSLAGKNAFPNGGAYNASKFGLIGFSEALMQEVRHQGVRVSYIMPGSVATDFNLPSERGADAWKVQPEDIAQIVLDLLAMPGRTLPSRVEVRPSRPPQR